MSETPRYIEAIAQRGETAEERVERLELQKKRNYAEQRRRDDAKVAAENTTVRLTHLARSLGVGTFIEDAVRQFGRPDVDELAVPHDKKGIKWVGAFASFFPIY